MTYEYLGRKCSKCKKDFIVGETIFRIVEQDYVTGQGNNAKKQKNIEKLCLECYNKIQEEINEPKEPSNDKINM